ncbi:TetR/AcrR family transcriptional regulator [Candidatus Gracilibacteria bacterium]|nr:TetR/AcrR family transcriptional regulator [Candidatus Gracilibacteria bacterium]
MYASKKILKIAKSEFEQNGYYGVSLNSIIAKTGVSKGGFYYYFQTKKDLLEKVLIEYTKTEILLPIQNLDTGQEFLDFIKDYIKFTARELNNNYFHNTNLLTKLTLELSNKDPKINKLVQTAFQQWEELLISILIQKLQGKEYSLSPDQLAKIMISLNQGLLLVNSCFKDSVRLEQEYDTITKLFQLLLQSRIIPSKPIELESIEPKLKSNETIFIPDGISKYIRLYETKKFKKQHHLI